MESTHTNLHQRLVLDESVFMCSGTCCSMRSRCYRFRLDKFYDTVARTPHPDPRWIEPAYSKKSRNCPFFCPTKYRE